MVNRLVRIFSRIIEHCDVSLSLPDFIWGVLDMVPDTDFPDVRHKSLVHSHNGSCLVIPREAERIRIYIQLADKDVLDPNTGRIDKDKMGPDQLLEVFFSLSPCERIGLML